MLMNYIGTTSEELRQDKHPSTSRGHDDEVPLADSNPPGVCHFKSPQKVDSISCIQQGGPGKSCPLGYSKDGDGDLLEVSIYLFPPQSKFSQ